MILKQRDITVPNFAVQQKKMRASIATTLFAALFAGISAQQVCKDEVAVVVTNPAKKCASCAKNGDTLFVNYNLTLLSTFQRADSSMDITYIYFMQKRNTDAAAFLR